MALGLLCASSAQAATIQSVEVSRDETRYTVTMHAWIDASATSAFAVFSDPARLPQINPAVQLAQVLGKGAAGATRLYSEVKVCVAVYCRTLHQTQDMLYAPLPDGGDIRAEMLPATGDFRSGSGEWHFRSAGRGTDLQFRAQMEPSFWIPPVIGPWIVERSLRAEAERTSEGIERLARAAGRSP